MNYPFVIRTADSEYVDECQTREGAKALVAFFERRYWNSPGFTGAHAPYSIESTQ